MSKYSALNKTFQQNARSPHPPCDALRPRPLSGWQRPTATSDPTPALPLLGPQHVVFEDGDQQTGGVGFLQPRRWEPAGGPPTGGGLALTSNKKRPGRRASSRLWRGEDRPGQSAGPLPPMPGGMCAELTPAPRTGSAPLVARTAPPELPPPPSGTLPTLPPKAKPQNDLDCFLLRKHPVPPSPRNGRPSALPWHFLASVTACRGIAISSEDQECPRTGARRPLQNKDTK